MKTTVYSRKMISTNFNFIIFKHENHSFQKDSKEMCSYDVNKDLLWNSCNRINKSNLNTQKKYWQVD